MTMKRDGLRLLPATAIVLAVLAVHPAAAADVSTGFAGGNGTSTPDQFVGTAGDGWLTAWTGTGTSSSVTSASPIDVGDYLSSTRTGAGNATLRRQFDLDAGAMVSGLPYDVEWTWRFDGEVTQMTVFDDRIHFFGDSNAIAGSGSSNSWLLGVVSNLNSSSGFDGGNFYLYKNSGGSPGPFNESNMVNTGVALDGSTAGDVFKFKVIADPVHGSYDATIMNTNTGETFTGANLKFRNATFDATTTQYLHFGSNANSSGDNTTFSLDTVQLTAHRDIVAHFDDLNTANKIDTFNSAAAGGGWAGEWGKSGSGISGTVATTDPLSGPGDPYLQVTAVKPTSGDQYYEVRREFENFGAIDVNKPHRVSWQWRLDGNLADFIDSGDDRLNFYADQDDAAGTNDSNAWLIGVTSDRGGFVNGDFYFYDGTSGNTFSGSNTVPTGMTLQEDVIYNFDVWVYPETKTYSARIIDEFGNSFSAANLGFRNLMTGTPGVTWDRLHFGGNINGSGDDQSFSLDSVTITQVPEPSALALAALGLLSLGFFRRRRRSRA